ncbi:Ankyrin repeat [Dillenia turbinata]|uniref:Ankyrin repeat n=1 Tax=Dillenia turbinata TaxID=194707 RepID=A0AAN8VIA5_9MAGN
MLPRLHGDGGGSSGGDGGESEHFDMQRIGNFLSFASRGDRVGLNQMLREGTSPNVQDYDKRTALHLAASEGHAPIVELLLHYKADVNLQDRWLRTPLTDARLYCHRDICRILEVNGGKDSINDNPVTIRHEQDSNEVNIDISVLNLQGSSIIEQGVYGESEKVKWRGTWIVKTYYPVKMTLSAMDNTFLRELQHPNILQFLGSVMHGEEMILITEYLPKGNLHDILSKKIRLDLPTALRYALDIARGMNYLHEHKPLPIVHNYLNSRNDDSSDFSYSVDDTKNDIALFGIICYQMLEGKHLLADMNWDYTHLKSFNFELNFTVSRYPVRIQNLIENCTSKDPSERPPFFAVIEVLEEVSNLLRRSCPVC